jgi:hypothetical protein
MWAKWALLGLLALYVSVHAMYVFGKGYRLFVSGGIQEPLLGSMRETLYELQIGFLIVLAMIWVFLDKAQRSFAAVLVATTIASLSTFAFLERNGYFYIKEERFEQDAHQKGTLLY